jgi:Trk K+ transport system NAD-binding subunit
MPVVVIDRNVDPADSRLGGAAMIRGDFRDRAILEKAGIADAHGVIVLTSDDLTNIATALLVRRLRPDVRIVVRMFNQNLLAQLGKAVRNVTTLSVSALTAPVMALTALTGEILGSFAIDDEQRQIGDMKISPNSILVGQTIARISSQFRSVPLVHRQAGQQRLLGDIDPATTIHEGDELFVCGEPRDLNRLRSAAQTAAWEELLLDVQWAGRLRRFGRMVWSAMREIDRALQFCAALMILVVMASTLLYYAGGMSRTIPDGLYRTISVIATGADMRGEEFVGWQKVFVSLLRIAGLMLVAAFTAIFTNYLLRARLGGALDLRRIPDGGHVVVCGLGNVGFRVVDELLRQEHQVVVVERKTDNPFIVSCRRLGAAVISGDAAVAEVLKQANAATARAVVAVTSDDLANIEIALLARDLNPSQRVVVRLSDPELAETVRQTVDIPLALSVPALAAPAFLAALYGDRVLGLFRIARTMLAAVKFTVPAGDPVLDGAVIRTIAIDYGVVPLGQGKGNPQPDPCSRLSAGQHLVVIGTLSDLDRLFRREPAKRDWGVALTHVPALARDAIVLLLRATRNLSASDVNRMVESLPARVADGLTRGEAEDFMELLKRERAAAQLVPPVTS